MNKNRDGEEKIITMKTTTAAATPPPNLKMYIHSLTHTKVMEFTGFATYSYVCINCADDFLTGFTSSCLLSIFFLLTNSHPMNVT